MMIFFTHYHPSLKPSAKPNGRGLDTLLEDRTADGPAVSPDGLLEDTQGTEAVKRPGGEVATNVTRPADVAQIGEGLFPASDFSRLRKFYASVYLGICVCVFLHLCIYEYIFVCISASFCVHLCLRISACVCL